MKFLSSKQKGSLYATASGLFYGLVGYFGISIVNANNSVSNMMFWRFLVASALITIALMPKFRTLNENFVEMLKMVISGGIFYGIGSIIYFDSSRYIGTGLAMVIFFTYPMMVIFLSWLLYKKGVTKVYYLSTIMVIIGLVLLADMGELKLDSLGIGLSILSAFFYAIYILFSKQSKLSALVSTYMVSIGCALASLIVALMNGSFALPVGLSVWVNILSMAVICTVLPILFLLEGLKYISARRAAILSVLEPIFVVVFGMLLLGEKVSLLQALGIVMILLGALITMFSHKLAK